MNDTLNTILKHMHDKAAQMNLPGVAVAGFYAPERGLVSQTRGCGKVFDGTCNYMAIAYTKIAEMCETGRDSGAQSRKALHGELAYTGGAIQATTGGCYVAAFSGAKGEEDYVIARHGLDGAANA